MTRFLTVWEKVRMDTLQWWVTVIEIPVIGVLFAMLMKLRSDLDTYKLKSLEAVASAQLHVAQNYVTTTHLRDIENRLADQLHRIEDKIDRITERGKE